MSRHKVWRVKQADTFLTTIISNQLDISPLVAQLLVNRGICTVDAARSFLSASTGDLAPPGLMLGMDRAVERISIALDQGEKILVYGDYDADGITSITLLVNLLRRFGGHVNYYVPHRVNEGYGLHLPALERARETGHSLVITVDCGISNHQAVAQNNKNGGPDIIITDHHEPPEILPPAWAILNPKQPGCNYPFRELAGVGVALKLAQALAEKNGAGQHIWREFLDLACVGTVADVVPLLGENRILVKNGLPVLAATTNFGLRALMEVSSVKPENIDARRVAFALAPRLNAAGRLGDARLAIDLLLAGSEIEAQELAAQLNKANLQRQKTESLVLAEALDMIENSPHFQEDKVLVLASANWHSGVVGIVASKLLDRFYRPVLLVALEGETGKGSARSVPGFHMYRALEKCRAGLTGYGGHALAAGFSLPSGGLDAFREEINRYAEDILIPEVMTPHIELDAVIPLSSINDQLINQLDILWPYGQGNPSPLLACRNVSLVHHRRVGKGGAHLKMLVKDGQVVFDGIGFNLGPYAETLTSKEVDLAFVPAFNEWNGKRLVQLNVKEIQPAATGFGHQPVEMASPRNITKHWPQFAGMRERVEMFRPGFLNKGLVKCDLLESPAGCVLPNHECDGEYDFSGAQTVAQPAEIIDRRNCRHRNEFLRGLDFDEKTVVVVNYPYQSLELFSYLHQSRVIPAEGAMLNPLLEDNACGLAAGEGGENVRVLVSTPELLQLPAGFEVDNLVFYNIPCYASEFYNLLTDCDASRVYFLYNVKDGKNLALYWQAMAPGREMMAGIYNCLRALLASGHHRFIKRQFVGIMAANGFPGMREFSISIALKVFKELRLLDYKDHDGEIRFKLYPVPGQKLSLEQSPTYKYLREIKTASLDWLRAAFEVDDPVELFQIN